MPMVNKTSGRIERLAVSCQMSSPPLISVLLFARLMPLAYVSCLHDVRSTACVVDMFIEISAPYFEQASYPISAMDR